MAVWGWICPLQREVELEEIDGCPAAFAEDCCCRGYFLYSFRLCTHHHLHHQTPAIYAGSPAE